MDVSKITPGPWKAVPWHIMEGNPAVQAPDGYLICETSCNDDAELIAEAGTVAHETKLSPRELAEQREELLAALIDLDEAYCDALMPVDLTKEKRDKGRKALIATRAIIAKCRRKP